MAETMWHYARDGATVGPVLHADLCSLFADKELPLETPVWHEGLADWVAAGSVDDFRGIWGKGFARHGGSPPPLPPDGSAPGRPGLAPVSPVQAPDTPIAPSAFRPGMEMRTGERRGKLRDDDEPWDGMPKGHPWIRYWARGLDYSILFTVAAFVYTPTTILEMVAMFYVVLILGASIVFPVQLMLFGQTIGKVVFGFHVSNEGTGEPLTLPQAVVREWRVLLKGQALGLPLVPLVTNVVAYRRLVRKGATSWDASGGLAVHHGDVGAVRWIAFIVLSIACRVIQAGHAPELDMDREGEWLRRHVSATPSKSMGSIVITEVTPVPATQPAAKKPKPKPKLLTLPSEPATAKPPIKQNSPNARPVRRPDRPAPGVVYKPPPAETDGQ